MTGLRYPYHDSQPFTGQPPGMVSPVNMASDLRYSGGTGPYYQERLMASHGRQLAGLGEVARPEHTEPAYATNELMLLAEMDDVQANGIFDPPGNGSSAAAQGSGPNIHPDAGILSARYDLPGYLARERMYAPSEVRDVTTGRPIIPVLNSPVSFDTSAQIAFIERGQYGVPQPVVDRMQSYEMPAEQTVNVRQNPIPIDKPPLGGVLGALDLSPRTALLGAIVLGAAAWALSRKG